MFGAVVSSQINEFKSVASLSPLAGNQRCFADIFNWFTRPLDRPDNRMIVGCHNRLQNRSWFVQVLGPLQDIHTHLQNSMFKPQEFNPPPPAQMPSALPQLLAPS